MMHMRQIQYNRINLGEGEELGGRNCNLIIIKGDLGEDINEGSLEETTKEGEVDKEDYKLREDLITTWEDI
jgi:hypothetical protein